MKEIQEWLGHSSYNTTANIYSHLDQKSKKNVASVITKVFDEEGEFDTFDFDLNNRDEHLEKPTVTKPVFMKQVKHRQNVTIPNVNETQITNNLEETIDELRKEQIDDKKDKTKSVFVYLNTLTGNLGAVKRFSDLDENSKFIKKVKTRDEANEVIFDLLCSGNWDKDYLTEFGIKLRKKINELSNENEM